MSIEIDATLCFFVKQALTVEGISEVYLPIKGDKVGKNFRNGYGGKNKNNETPRQCAAREVFEESGGVIVNPRDLRYVARGEFTTDNGDRTKTIFKVDIFIVNAWTGNPISTNAMFDGKWYPIHNLPINELMQDDRTWLAKVLGDNTSIDKNGKKKAQFYLIDTLYGPNQGTLIRSSLTPNRQIQVD